METNSEDSIHELRIKLNEEAVSDKNNEEDSNSNTVPNSDDLLKNDEDERTDRTIVLKKKSSNHIQLPNADEDILSMSSTNENSLNDSDINLKGYVHHPKHATTDSSSNLKLSLSDLRTGSSTERYKNNILNYYFNDQIYQIDENELGASDNYGDNDNSTVDNPGQQFSMPKNENLNQNFNKNPQPSNSNKHQHQLESNSSNNNNNNNNPTTESTNLAKYNLNHHNVNHTHHDIDNETKLSQANAQHKPNHDNKSISFDNFLDEDPLMEDDFLNELRQSEISLRNTNNLIQTSLQHPSSIQSPTRRPPLNLPPLENYDSLNKISAHTEKSDNLEDLYLSKTESYTNQKAPPPFLNGANSSFPSFSSLNKPNSGNKNSPRAKTMTNGGDMVRLINGKPSASNYPIKMNHPGDTYDSLSARRSLLNDLSSTSVRTHSNMYDPFENRATGTKSLFDDPITSGEMDDMIDIMARRRLALKRLEINMHREHSRAATTLLNTPNPNFYTSVPTRTQSIPNFNQIYINTPSQPPSSILRQPNYGPPPNQIFPIGLSVNPQFSRSLAQQQQEPNGLINQPPQLIPMQRIPHNGFAPRQMHVIPQENTYINSQLQYQQQQQQPQMYSTAGINGIPTIDYPSDREIYSTFLVNSLKSNYNARRLVSGHEPLNDPPLYLMMPSPQPQPPPLTQTKTPISLPPPISPIPQPRLGSQQKLNNNNLNNHAAVKNASIPQQQQSAQQFQLQQQPNQQFNVKPNFNINSVARYPAQQRIAAYSGNPIADNRTNRNPNSSYS